MDKYFEADKQLAELLGYTPHILQPWPYAGVKVKAPDGAIIRKAPRWTQDKAAVFELLVENGITFTEVPTERGHSIIAWQTASQPYNTRVKTLLSEHPDNATAIRYAIVLAVIEKLKKEVA